MAKVTIFVEGISDKIFIRAFVSHHYNIDLIVEDKQKAPLIGDIISLGGKSKLEDAQVILEMKKQIGYTNLLILDADNPEKNAGFEKVKSEITNIIEQKNLAIDDFFLFPNHQDDGDLEDLLIQTVNPKNQVIFDCWKAYESCLQDIKIEGRTETLTTPLTLNNYPNPVVQITTITFDIVEKGTASLALYDAYGRLVQMQDVSDRGVGAHTFQWNLEDLANGTYFIEFKNAAQKTTRTIVKVK